ncbi:SDR family oxidoreductase [Maritimibacter sp. UBA3975]|uniref:SDR family oxidoreductase n=1 Tax=Maritimibacter sp. UBA3975 TaxID=1946833 RepID=UPI000C09C50D|nr:SDR family oxidoreductase [Maritimibacter sp. UBA3975]MAM62135.1 short chain dehydrogenase [Maritimibacter sp.]|tara:strand:+ start:217 stop:993 length:777 start_codon:yes stop_codon:yes gene_type:complete
MSGALVTGAGGRLGQAMAIYLASRGYDVAVHYAGSREGAETTVAACRAQGVRAEAVQADLLDDDAVAGLVPEAAKAVGPLTVLVNNASIFEFDEIDSMTAESWTRNIGSNLRAPMFLTQAFAEQVPDPETDERGEPIASALVLNMIDQRVKKLTPHFTTYTIAKMGLWAFTQTAARALAPRVRVNGIGPGPTLKGANQSEDEFAHQRENTVLERGSNPEDITGALGYFLDAKAVSGQMLAVDGGQHLGWKTPENPGRD